MSQSKRKGRAATRRPRKAYPPLANCLALASGKKRGRARKSAEVARCPVQPCKIAATKRKPARRQSRANTPPDKRLRPRRRVARKATTGSPILQPPSPSTRSPAIKSKETRQHFGIKQLRQATVRLVGLYLIVSIMFSSALVYGYSNLDPAKWGENLTEIMASGAKTSNQSTVLRDRTAPKISDVQNVVAEATGLKTLVELPVPTVTDNIDPDPTLTNDAPPDGFRLGTTIVAWTATDDAGNKARANQKVTVRDTTAPVITPPPDVVAYAGDSSEYVSVSLGEAEVIDAVDPFPVVSNDAPSDGFPVGSTVVTWTATDAAGNYASANQLVSVVVADSSSSDSGVTTDSTDATTSSTTDAGTSTTSSGDTSQSDATYSSGGGGGGAAPSGSSTETTSSSTTSDSTTQTVSDTTPPAIYVPPDVSAEATGTLTQVELGTPIVSDTQDPEPVVTNDAPADGYPLGLTVVTWNATDASGNTATAEQKVLIRDTTAPTLVPPADIVLEATGILTLVASLGSPDVSDLIDPSPVVSNDAPSDGYWLGNTTVTWTAKDTFGNTATEKQKVTIVDTTPPAIIAPDDTVAYVYGESELAIIPLGAASASDIADNAPVITNDAPADGFPVGTTTVMWTATDASGNHATDTQVVTILLMDGGGGVTTDPSPVDVNPPTIVAPPDVTAVATGPLTAVELGTPTVSDLEDPDPTVTNDAPAGGFLVGTTVVTWTATDAAGNSASAAQKVTVLDTEKPTLALPSGIVVEAISASGSVVDYSAQVSAVDLVDGTLVPVCEPASGSTFALGTTTVTCSVIDSEGNEAGGTFDVVVQDTTSPSLIAPADIVTDATDTLTAVSLGLPTVSDMVDPSPTVTNDAPADGFQVGTTTVTWTATDAAGNVDIAAQLVTVQDTTTYYTIPTIGGVKPTTVTYGSTVYTVCDSGCSHTTIKNAIDALPSDGGKVILKGSKMFSPSSTIYLRSNLVIEFEAGTTMTYSSSGKVFYGNNVNNIMFINPVITKSKYADDVLYFTNADTIIIQGGKITGVKGSSSSGFECRSCKNVLVQGGTFSTFSRPIDVGTSTSTIDGSTWNIWVVENTVYDSSIECLKINRGYDVHAIRNDVKDCANNGIDVGFNIGAEAINNKIHNAGYGTQNNAVGIHTDSSDLVVLVDNMIEFSGTNGITVCGSDNNYVLRNTIRYSGQAVTDTLFVNDGHGIEVISCSGGTMKADNTVIDQNLISDSNDGYGVYVSSSATNTYVTNNTLLNNEKGPYMDVGSNTVISGNTAS